ncbi:MAG TPA: hypothetical protein VK468_08745 [Pyrinomonadaceae bacterium]|nr:hypothetical protein [Pyrinomonadaceae bacterium]
MIRRSNVAIILTLVLVFASSALAQSAPVRGKVVLKKADNTIVPLAGALVEAFQTDIKATAPPAKTDKNGKFSFAGLRLSGIYILSVSGPGATPNYMPNVPAGADNVTITLTEGDGSRLPEDEVRTGAAQVKAGSGSAGTTAQQTTESTEEQKKKQAERDAEVARITAKNSKALKTNEVVNQALKDGDAAYTAKNFDAAVAAYTTGIDADPDFAGSAPTLLNNRGAALLGRAVLLYNQNAKSTDATTKIAAFKKVRQDFADAIDSYDRSLKVIKAVTPADQVDPKLLETNRLDALRGAKESFRLMALTEQVDEKTTPVAKVLIPEYIASEADPVKKEAAKIILADVYRVAGDSDNAILAYRQVLEASPDNLDAMSGLGFSLVNNGYIKDDKSQLQEGANYLQKFASAAPDTNKFKADALGLIESLKKDQNVAPAKVGGKKKN